MNGSIARVALALLLAVTGLVAAPAAAQAPKPASPLAPFDRTLTLQGVSFRVVCANNSSINQLEIVPAGLHSDSRRIIRTIDGTVVGAEVADLNGDGSPEVYVYVSSAGSGSYGSLVAYGAVGGKSLNRIRMPALDEHPTVSKGYMGHDEFAIVEDTLVRRFPVYKPGDSNVAATDGTRQLRYRLAKGEWPLRLNRVVED